MLWILVFVPGLVVSLPFDDVNCDVFGCEEPDPAQKKDANCDVFGCEEEPVGCDDDVFGCEEPDECDDVLDDCPPENLPLTKCIQTDKDIETAIFKGDKRQAFNDCNKTTSCHDYRDQDYECAPYWQCHKNTSTIITDGEGIINVRNIDPDTCLTRSGALDLDASDTKCHKEEEVCCKRPDFRQERCQPPKDSKWGKCGRKNTDGDVSVRVTGFSENKQLHAQPGEFPHVCIVYKHTSGIRGYIGGASLIAENKVLTVAHKFYFTRGGANVDDRDIARKFFVRCGEYNVKAQTELLIHQETRVVEMIFDPKYNPSTLAHNLVILRTEENFFYQSHIGPICLPQPGDNFESDEDCWSAGWGSSDFTSQGVYSDALKKIDMPVVPRDECLQRLRAAPRPGSKFVLEDSWLCVGGEEGKDTCTGDGGSPHICRNKQGDWTQVGSVAFGFGCGDAIPAIYSSVAASICWIDWVMSCKPLARYYVDATDSGDVDIRATDVDSANGFTLEQCGDWADANKELTSMCNVEYLIDYEFYEK